MEFLQDYIQSHSTLETLLKFLLAVLLSGLLGLERERKGRPAGLRTHVLVCLGATLLMIVGEQYTRTWAGGDTGFIFDPGRVAAGIITGVGFLGAGTIMRTSVTPHGLTTAAMIWFVAALGVAIGSGFYTISVFTTLLALCLTIGFEYLEGYLPDRAVITLGITTGYEKLSLAALQDIVASVGHSKILHTRIKTFEQDQITVTLTIRTEGSDSFNRLLQLLHTTYPEAENISLESASGRAGIMFR